VFVGGAGGPTACNSHPFSAQSTAGPLVDALAESCQLVLVNPRGVGGSSPGREPADYTFRRHVDDLEAVRRRLGVDRWVFFGGSGGGCIGLLYALWAPRALSGLIARWIGPSGRRIAADARSNLSPCSPERQRALLAAPLSRHPTILRPFGAAPG